MGWGVVVFERIKDFLSSTTGLTSPLKMRPVPQNAFVSAFAVPPGGKVSSRVRDLRTQNGISPGPPGETVGRILFETGLDAIQKVSDRAVEFPSLLYDTARRVGVAITRFIHPEGGAISVLSDRNGRSIDGADAGLTTNAARAAASPEPLPSPMEEARRANETVMRYRLQSVAQSPERIAFQDFIQPFDSTGNPNPVAQMGWTGLIHAVRGLPVPRTVAGTDAVMDVIGGRSLRMGVSVLACAETREATLRNMLHKALELNLAIPPRQDGKAWNVDSPLDNELARALCGRSDSPFVTGKMVEGAPVLLNDTSLVDLGRVSSRLTPAALERTFSKVRIAAEQSLVRQESLAPTAALAARAREDLKALRASSEFSTYDDCRNGKAAGYVAERHEAVQVRERRRTENPNGIDAFLAHLENLDNGSATLPIRQDVLPESPAYQHKEELSWSDVSSAFPGWSPGREHIHLKMEDGAIVPTLRLTDTMMEMIGTKTQTISDMDGFILTDLQPGVYNIEGADSPLTVLESNGVKSMSAPVRSQVLEPPTPDLSPVLSLLPTPF